MWLNLPLAPTTTASVGRQVLSGDAHLARVGQPTGVGDLAGGGQLGAERGRPAPRCAGSRRVDALADRYDPRGAGQHVEVVVAAMGGDGDASPGLDRGGGHGDARSPDRGACIGEHAGADRDDLDRRGGLDGGHHGSAERRLPGDAVVLVRRARGRWRRRSGRRRASAATRAATSRPHAVLGARMISGSTARHQAATAVAMSSSTRPWWAEPLPGSRSARSRPPSRRRPRCRAPWRRRHPWDRARQSDSPMADHPCRPRLVGQLGGRAEQLAQHALAARLDQHGHDGSRRSGSSSRTSSGAPVGPSRWTVGPERRDRAGRARPWRPRRRRPGRTPGRRGVGDGA